MQISGILKLAPETCSPATWNLHTWYLEPDTCAPGTCNLSIWHLRFEPAPAMPNINTVNKENPSNKKVLLTYKKELLPYKQDLHTYTKRDLLTITKNRPQIPVANSHGKIRRQILTANSHDKFSRQIPTANYCICIVEDGVE